VGCDGGALVKIPPFRLRPEPLTNEAATLSKFKWAGAEVGTRPQLGGEPTFLQAPEHPSCPVCGLEMTFYGQLDSVNDDITIADAGMVYVFMCFEDFTTTALVQSA
jgi:hypothetical protein